jgi:hypothetical protein
MGAGLAGGKSKIRWKVTRDILLAWAITIPCVAVLGATMELISRVAGGSIIVVSLALLIALSILVTRNWTWESTAQLRVRLNIMQKIRIRRTKKLKPEEEVIG